MAGANNPINLFIDVVNRRLVSGPTSTVIATLPTFYQDNEQAFNLTFLTPLGSGIGLANPYAYVNVQGQPFTLSFGAQPLGNGSITPAAIQTSWTWVNGVTVNAGIPSTGAGYLTGSIAFNTTAVNTLLGSASSYTGVMEFDFTNPDATETTVLQAPATINAVLNATSSTVPVPATSYFTAAQANSIFMPFVGKPGQTLTFVSPNGAYKYTIGVDNNGQPLTLITHT